MTINNYIPALVSNGSTNHLDVINSHSYTSEASSPITGTSLQKWNTEGGPSGAFTTTWYSSGAANEGFTWANKLAVAMVKVELSAYLFWQGFQVGNTGSALHLVDTLDGTTATPSGIFWAFAMWSRHIRPGAYRVATSGSMTNVITGAFVNTDGSVVVVFTNSGSSSQSARVSFSGFTPGAASSWVTSNSAMFASTSAALSGSKVSVSVPGRGVVTVKLTK
jgi:O-glycosyl hydrolase